MAQQYFIRPTGKGEFRSFRLINAQDFGMLDFFFETEDDAKGYATKKGLEVVEYEEGF